ncbi:MAG: hypothetical protein AB8B95_13625, partial [Pseudohongiellaceae bacterium]
MTVTLLFYMAFLGQIVLISYILPRKIEKNIQYVLKNYSPADYPKLYPKPFEYYTKRIKGFRVLCRTVLALGFILLGLFVTEQFNNDMQTIVP